MQIILVKSTLYLSKLYENRKLILVIRSRKQKKKKNKRDTIVTTKEIRYEVKIFKNIVN